MNPLEIIEQYYDKQSSLYHCLVSHGEQVARKALSCAKKFEVDLKFIQEAAMLHDIGIFYTYAPKIGCYGNLPYIYHGYMGMVLLDKLGWHRHAQVCLRHVGVGFSIEDIQQHHLKLPQIDMQPQTLEEQLICYADKFFSKTSGTEEKSIDNIQLKLSQYNHKALEKFMKWHSCFS